MDRLNKIRDSKEQKREGIKQFPTTLLASEISPTGDKREYDPKQSFNSIDPLIASEKLCVFKRLPIQNLKGQQIPKTLMIKNRRQGKQEGNPN